MVVSDLLLPAEATPVVALALSGELALALENWDGPGVLVIAGNLFDLTGAGSPHWRGGERAIGDPPPAPRGALGGFTAEGGRRVIRQTGTPARADTDPATVAAPGGHGGGNRPGPVDLRAPHGGGDPLP